MNPRYISIPRFQAGRGTQEYYPGFEILEPERNGLNSKGIKHSKTGWNPVNGEINDSLSGNYLWSCINVGEAITAVMTPFTYSFGHNCFSEFDLIPGIPLTGNIGGRIYANRSLELMLQSTFGKLAGNLKISTEALAGEMDWSIDPPRQTLKLSKGVLIGKVLPNGFKILAKHRWKARNINGFVALNSAWCRSKVARIGIDKKREDMLSIWLKEINPYVIGAFHKVIATALRFGIISGKLRPVLVEMVGSADAEILMTNAGRNAGLLESLGPVVGLSRVAHGLMSREDYLDTWGHRGFLEIEAAVPRPVEQSGWLDRELKAYKASNVDVDALLNAKHSEYEDAWERLRKRYPGEAKGIQRRLERCTLANQEREAVRSEFIRLIFVVRSWARQSGKVAGIDDEVFFLTLEELLELLSGKDDSIRYIPARKRTYERYKALPPYPPLISGRFDPFQWAGNLGECRDRNVPGRKYDNGEAVIPGANIIKGVPGSAGEAIGTVRRLSSPEESDQLIEGEILVTSATNIGWTLLFPRAAAIVTDIGASLSHAAIVARELGIPAVVNCGDATSRLRTGDKIRVDGSKGIVEIMEYRIQDKDSERLY